MPRPRLLSRHASQDQLAEGVIGRMKSTSRIDDFTPAALFAAVRFLLRRNADQALAIRCFKATVKELKK